MGYELLRMSSQELGHIKGSHDVTIFEDDGLIVLAIYSDLLIPSDPPPYLAIFMNPDVFPLFDTARFYSINVIHKQEATTSPGLENETKWGLSSTLKRTIDNE
jgi:hypothetical protein